MGTVCASPIFRESSKMSSKSPRKVGRPRKYPTDRARWRASQQAHRERLRLENQANKSPVIFSSKSWEWYTPPDLIESVLRFWGILEFDCDPASPRVDGPVPAKIRYTIREDGLSQPWMGKVWLNPPYGRQLGLWVQKAIAEVQTGRAEVVCLLIPGRTDTRWWHSLMDAGAQFHFLPGRIRFLRENGEPGDASPFPSVLVFLGQRHGDDGNKNTLCAWPY